MLDTIAKPYAEGVKDDHRQVTRRAAGATGTTGAPARPAGKDLPWQSPRRSPPRRPAATPTRARARPQTPRPQRGVLALPAPRRGARSPGHRRAAGRQRLPVADQVVRRRRPPVDRPRQLPAAAAATTCSGRRSATPSAMIVAMVVVPTLLGLLLAAVLFDYIGKRFGRARPPLLRAAFYLPQVLPVVVAGIVWGWILRPRRRVQQPASTRSARRAAPRLARRPGHRAAGVMAVMVWVQIGYPVVIFMAALQRVDPELYEAAEIDGANWLAPVPGDHPAADPAGDLRGRPDLHHRRAEGVRADLRPDPGRPGQRHQRAVLLRLLHVLQEAAGRLRRRRSPPC